MKANFKKASVFAIAIALVLLMSLSVIPMVSATEEAATTPDAYYELETDYTGDLQESIDAMNISLTGRITLTIYYVIKEDSAHDYIELTVPDLDENGKKTTRKYTEKYDPEKLDENGRYPVSVSVAAAQQTELIKFQWFGKNGEKGKWRSYSVRYYANKIMDLAAAEDPAENVQKMDHTVKSMLNYGAMAQLRFGYKTEKLANEGLFDNTNPVDNMLVDHLYDATANPVVDTFFLGTNVSLEDDIRMKVYVNAPEGTEVTIDGNTEKKTSVRKDAAGTYVGIYNIPANQFAKQFEIAVDGHDPIYYSILGWCKSALESYKTTEEEKNIAKALYQYYTWTTNYTDDTYVPGPKTEDENGNVVSACTHERYYVKGENVLCSDCGENISTTTRVSLVPDGTLTIADGATVTFTLKVVGDVNLSGLIVTPTVTGLTLSNPKVTNIDETGNIVTTAGKNIVIDTQNAVTSACELVKVTYTVTVNEGYNAGSYKIGLTVQDSAGTAPNLVTPVTTVLKVVNPDCTHVHDKYDTNAAGHRWDCAICQQVGKWEEHDTTDVSWTHVLADEGGKVTGELYEEKICTVCKNAAETRKLYYYNSIDSIRVNGTVVNPYKSNVGQSVGIKGAPASGYNTFVVSPENFIDANKNLLTFHDTDSFKTGGWFAVNGGVERYVIRINDGAWQTLTGTFGPVPADSVIGKAIVGNANITDKEGAFKNASYQGGGLAYHDFEAYAGQTVTITLGAVPANNPGTEENPNVLITAVIKNLKIERTHLAQNVTSVEATDDPTVFNATCGACGESYTTSDVNEECLKMFNADEIVYRGAGQGGSNYSITKMTENGLDFARFELLYNKPAYKIDENGEAILDAKGNKQFIEHNYYFANDNKDNATNLTYGLSDTFMIVYRANKAYPGELTLYLNQGAWKSQAYSIKDDSQWHIAMYDLSALYDDAYGRLNTIRFDIFDAVDIEQGATIDIAYMGFFKSEDHALENYAKAAEKHEAIGKAANWALNLDSILVDGTNYKGKNPPVSGSTGQFGCIQVDLEGYTIATSKSSIIFRGWLVTPFGAEGIYYTITDADGNVSERKLYVKPGNAYSGILTKSTSYRYGSQRGNGSIFQSTNTAFDLSKYERQTVSIDVILVNNIGQEGTIMQIKNVAVPCTHKAADDAVWTLDENDPMFEKADCLYCDEKAERYVSDTTNGLLLWTPNEIYSKSNSWSNGNVTINNDNGLPYVHYEYTGAQTTVKGECFANLYGNIADPLKVGKYAAILYRTTHTGSVEVYANSNADKVNGPNVNFGGNTNNLNEWTFRVKEFPANADTTKYDAQQQTAVRLDWFNYTVNNPLKTGDTVDIAFIAYFDTEAEAYAFFSKYVKAYGEESWCDHKYINTEWISAEKIYEFTCATCGKLMSTSDMLYKSEAYSNGTVSSGSNFLTASTVTENGENFVRYTPSITNAGDPYFYTWYDHTSHVTGEYMVIKYRLVNKGINKTAASPFSGSAASGQTGATGSNKSSNTGIINSSTVYADGEWHYLVVAPNVAKNTSFTTNADGTYTWRFFRINIGNFAASDGTCYFDVDEIAFSDNIEAAYNYIKKSGQTKDANLKFSTNIDTFTGATSTIKCEARTNDKVNTIDMSGLTLKSATSLTPSGWFITPGSVDSYKLRVTPVGGESSELINWINNVTTLGNTDGVTAVGLGRCFGYGCGSRFSKAIDLSAWAGQTVNVEIVAITPYGAEVSIINLTNVTVPAAK